MKHLLHRALLVAALLVPVLAACGSGDLRPTIAPGQATLDARTTAPAPASPAAPTLSPQATAPGEIGLLWSAPGEMPTSFVLDGSMLYLGRFDNHVYALDARSGAERWRVKFADWIYPRAVSAGVLCVAGNDRNFYGLDTASGKILWTYAPESGDEVLAGNGMFYTREHDGVVALDARTGTVRWESRVGSLRTPERVVGPLLYLVGDDEELYVLDALTGQQRHVYTDEGIDRWFIDGDLLVLQAMDDLYIGDPATGEIRFKVPGEHAEHLGYAAGTLYASARDGNATLLQAIDAASGTLRWSAPISSGVYAVAATDEVVAFALEGASYGDEILLALDPESGQELWREEFETGGFSSVEVAEELVLFGAATADSLLVAAFEAASGKERWRFAGPSHDDGGDVISTALDVLPSGAVAYHYNNDFYLLELARGVELLSHSDLDHPTGLPHIQDQILYLEDRFGTLLALGPLSLRSAEPGATPRAIEPAQPVPTLALGPQPPLYPGASVLRVEPDPGGRHSTTVLAAHAGRDEILAFYREQLPAQGWVFIEYTTDYHHYRRLDESNPQQELALYVRVVETAGQPATVELEQFITPLSELQPTPTRADAVATLTALDLRFVKAWGAEGDEQRGLSSPEGIALDSQGAVYLTDASNQVKKYSADGIFIKAWGGDGQAEGQFVEPLGIVVGTEDRVYVVDSGNARVQVFDPEGTFLFAWPLDGGPDGSLSAARGIAVDRAGNVYVADTWMGRVQKFSPEGQLLASWEQDRAQVAGLYWPSGIGVAANGDVYVSDSIVGRIIKYNAQGEIVLVWPIEPSGPEDRIGTDWLAVSATGTVYITDVTRSVIMFDSRGTPLGRWGTEGEGDGEFDVMGGIALAPDGRIFVVDSHNNRVQVFAPR